MRPSIFALAAALIAAPTVASAWGSEGHEIIAAIARDNLTPKARAWVDRLPRMSAAQYQAAINTAPQDHEAIMKDMPSMASMMSGKK